MRRILLFLGLCVSVIRAADSIPAQPVSTPAHALAPGFIATPAVPAEGRSLWRLSLAALAVSNALDIQSSWGKHELNSTLASQSGDFGAQGALLKLGFQGGLISVEYLITRRHPGRRLYRTLAFINFGASVGIAGVAAHNYTVTPPGH
jgi:hypothetical protein